MRAFLAVGQQVAPYGLLDTHSPWPDRVHYELKRLLLDVAERSFFEVAYHVRRNSEHPGNFGNLEFAGFQKLRMVWIDADSVDRHAFFEYGHLVRISRSLVPRFPGLFQSCRRRLADQRRMLQVNAGPGIVGEKPCPECLGRN